MKTCLMISAVCAVVAVHGGDLNSVDPFGKFDYISSRELLPRDARFAVAKDGTFLVNGKKRYLTGTIFYGALEQCLPTSGYGDALKWLYEALPEYRDMQRVGVDALGFESGREWMDKIDGLQIESWKRSGLLPSVNGFDRIFAGQLPSYVDFTPSEWGHGGIEEEKNPQIPSSAWTRGDHHWVRYSVVNKPGRDIWLTMWSEQARRYSKWKTPPYCYELMNEPAVMDVNPESFRAFEKERGIVYDKKSVKCQVEYQKFIEDKYASLIEEGTRRIKEIQPGAMTTVQPLFFRAAGVNMYKLSKVEDVICSPTGGGRLIGAHCLRAIARGKPIVDGETYVGTTAKTLRNALISQYQRGFNASYTFKWCKRARDWRTPGDSAAEEAKARRLSPYYILNPYMIKAEELLGFRLARRDSIEVDAFFTRRDRGTPRQIAALFSNCDMRLRSALRMASDTMLEAVVNELDYAHLNPDVVFEEQIAANKDVLSNYKAIVLPALTTMDGKCREALEQWAKRGGTVISVGKVPEVDEYGEKTATSLATSAITIDPEGIPIGKVGEKMAEIAVKRGVYRSCETPGGENVEVSDARLGKCRAWLVTSRAVSPQVVRFIPKCESDVFFGIRSERKSGDKIACRRQRLERGSDGDIVLYLEPNDVNIVVSGSEAELAAVIPASSDTEFAKPLSYAEMKSAAERRMSEYRREKLAKVGGYKVKENKTRRLDLRQFANKRILSAKDWGLKEVDGVPFEFIRSDQNYGKDTIVMRPGDEARQVALGGKILHLYARLRGSIRIALHFTDGSSIRGELKGDRNFLMTRRWTNECSTKDVQRIDILPGDGTAVLLAMTAEDSAESSAVIGRENIAKVTSFSREGALSPTIEDGAIVFAHGPKPSSWSGGVVEFKEPVELPQGEGRLRLAFEINSVTNRWGREDVIPGLQMSFRMKDVESGNSAGSQYRSLKRDDGLTNFGGVDRDKDSWETVYLDIDKKFCGENMAFAAISYQYQIVTVAAPSGYQIRNLRLERVAP